MYYLKIGFSIIFVISFFGSLVYLLSLSVKVATRLMDRKEATLKSFIASLFTWISMFTVVIIWQDKSHWNIGTWIMVFVLLIGISIVSAMVSAFGLWYRKK